MCNGTRCRITRISGAGVIVSDHNRCVDAAGCSSTGVGCASAVVVAGDRRVDAARCRITAIGCAGAVVVAVQGCSSADAAGTNVACGTGVVVITGRCIVVVLTNTCYTGIGCADIPVITVY